MLFAARKDKVDMLGELNVGAKQSLRSLLWIFSYLLKFIDGDIHLFATLVEIIEDVTNSNIFLCWFHRDGDTRFACQWIHAKHWA